MTKRAARGPLRDGRSERRRGRWTGPVALSLTAAVGVPAVVGLVWAGPAAADPADPAATGECSIPSKPYKERPWDLQRLLFDQLWADTKGKGVKVAVIDSGVDAKNPQLKKAVDTHLGKKFLHAPKKDKYGQKPPHANANGTTDTVGHGTKVAGIIAARPADGTGFVGLAPEATIIPIQQNDASGSGTAGTLVKSIDYAVKVHADVINISQDTKGSKAPGPELGAAVQKALDAGVVVVASAGNEGQDGKLGKTYPASYEGVLAVAASDRNNERAVFSQSGHFVDIAAPGVDMISTVPGKGHCADNGTSFSAPFVSGVAALLRAKHKDWGPEEIVAQIEQTAERSVSGADPRVGWGVIDPVRALTEDDHPLKHPVDSGGVHKAKPPTPAKLQLGETAQERSERLGTFVVMGAGVAVAVIGGSALVYRDWRRRTGN